MRALRIFLLHCQRIFEYRLKSFIWFLAPLMNSIFLIVFWRAALNGKSTVTGWTMSDMTAYYLLLAVASTFLNSHVEDGVADEDIRQGDLARFLLKPISYYWIKFCEETPYRLLQCVYGIIFVLISTLVWGNFLKFSLSIENTILFIMIVVLAYFISFTYKLSLGLTAFWFKDAKGLHSALDVVALIFGGAILPIQLFPDYLQKIAYLTPFPYIIYYPITAFQNKYSINILFQIIGFQFFWLSIMLIFNRVLWNKGIKIFTAAGR